MTTEKSAKKSFESICFLKRLKLSCFKLISDINNKKMLNLMHIGVAHIKYHSKGITNNRVVDTPRNPKGCALNILHYTLHKISLMKVVHAQGVEVKEESSMDKLLHSQPSTSDITMEDVRAILDKETGFDRVKQLFLPSSSGQFHDDLIKMGISVSAVAMPVFLVSFVRGCKRAGELYKRKNKATKYMHRMAASRRYHDAMMVGGITNGVRWAVRVSFFSVSLMTTTMIIERYRNKTSFINLPIAGAITGALLRANMGLTAMSASGLIVFSVCCLVSPLFVKVRRLENDTQEGNHYAEIVEQIQEKRRMERMAARAREKHGVPAACDNVQS